MLPTRKSASSAQAAKGAKTDCEQPPEASQCAIDTHPHSIHRLGRHLASLLAHSLALCADPVADDTLPQPLAAIPGSPSASPSLSRNTSLSTDSISLEAGTCSTSSDFEPVLPALPLRTGPLPPAFPVVSEAKRLKLIGNLQSWSFNAMSYSPDELLACVGIMFESVRNMAGVDFDLGK